MSVAKPGTKALIICADDFAVHEGASLGIAALATAGRISATSVMVLSPRWSADVALLQPLRGDIDVGLHLDWTSEFASLAGHGVTLYRAMRRAALGGFDRRQAVGVIERQLDLFEAHWCQVPDYVDGHQHVQQFAGIREALVEVLAKRYQGASARPYLRVSRPVPGAADLKSRVISWMGAAALEAQARRAGLVCVSPLSGVYDFQGDDARFAALMQGWLAGAPSNSIVMCHPAKGHTPGDDLEQARSREFEYLGSEAFGLALARAGVQLTRGLAGRGS